MAIIESNSSGAKEKMVTTNKTVFLSANDRPLNTERAKSSPLYLQIYHDICMKVDDGFLKSGEPMPTEQELMNYYGVSRVTVRKALMELISDGIITREHSKSAIIAHKKPRKNMSRLTSLREEILSAGLTPRAQFTVIQNVGANSNLAAALNVPEGEPLIYFHRIRYGDDIPIAVQDVHIRAKYCSIEELKSVGDNSIYNALECGRGITIDYADMILSAKMPTKKQCQELNTNNDAPVLLMKRTAFLTNGETLEYAETYYVTSRYEWTARAFRNGKHATPDAPPPENE